MHQFISKNLDNKEFGFNKTSFTTINNGLFMGLDMTLVIKWRPMLCNKALGPMITGTNHNDKDSKQILSVQTTWSEQVKLLW